MTLHLEWLADHPQHSDTFAGWIHRQFHYEYAEQPLLDWQREFAEGQINGDWKCLIALEGDQLKGGAALAKADLAASPGSWPVAGLRVHHARSAGKGNGGAFDRGDLRGCESQRCVEDLSAHPGQTRLLRQAWLDDAGSFSGLGKEQWLMVRDL